MVRRQNTDTDRPYPLMWDGNDYIPLPLESLTFDSIGVQIVAPYNVRVSFFSTTRELIDNRAQTDTGLVGRGIHAGDMLIFDRSRTAPQDDAIMLVQDGRHWIARVCRVLAEGWVEFHAAAEGYPILTGERRIWGTLAAVIRATDGREVASA